MIPVSVIVVSRGRPGPLGLCLTGLGQLCYDNYELVVVADPAGSETVSALGLAHRIKSVAFDLANISAARNAGIAAAAGAVLAFIDDDAVPEPSWLARLVAPFADGDVAATGGYVIGRDGIRLQYGARAVNAMGETVELTAAAQTPFTPALPAGFRVKTEGTNMAVRREVLAGLGGFDPAYRFYLDETDLDLRLAAAGARVVLAPGALVHHAVAASDRRGADRAPRDLTEIGASAAVFARKHEPGTAPEAVLARLVAGQRRLLIGHMVAGRLEPSDVGRLLDGLAAGFRAGWAREIVPPGPIGGPEAGFLPFEGRATGASRHIAGRVWSRRRLRAQAAEALARGETVTLFRLSPTALRHRVRFHPGGWWEHSGGVFGRSARGDPAFRLTSFRARVAREWGRVAAQRQCR